MAILYLAVSSGVVMEIHYCMGKIAGVDLYATGNDHCGKCGMKEKKGGCCNDEVKIYKLQDSHKSVVNTISFEILSDAEAVIYPVQQSYPPAENISLALQNHSPPDITQPSLRVLNCVFRI